MSSPFVPFNLGMTIYNQPIGRHLLCLHKDPQESTINVSWTIWILTANTYTNFFNKSANFNLRGTLYIIDL